VVILVISVEYIYNYLFVPSKVITDVSKDKLVVLSTAEYVKLPQKDGFEVKSAYERVKAF
jgi:hypothetical protein